MCKVRWSGRCHRHILEGRKKVVQCESRWFRNEYGEDGSLGRREKRVDCLRISRWSKVESTGEETSS